MLWSVLMSHICLQRSTIGFWDNYRKMALPPLQIDKGRQPPPSYKEVIDEQFGQNVSNNTADDNTVLPNVPDTLEVSNNTDISNNQDSNVLTTGVELRREIDNQEQLENEQRRPYFGKDFWKTCQLIPVFQIARIIIEISLLICVVILIWKVKYIAYRNHVLPQFETWVRLIILFSPDMKTE